MLPFFSSGKFAAMEEFPELFISERKNAKTKMSFDSSNSDSYLKSFRQ